MPDPEHTVAEMARVRAAATCSSRVPREPLWRGLNMARGAYLKRPRQHARAPQPLVQARVRARCSSRHGEVVEARSPFPWTMLLVRALAAGRDARRDGRRRAAALRPRRADPVGRHRLDRASSRSPTSRSPPRRSTSVDVQADLAAVVGDVRDHLGDLPADRAAALAHDRRPPRARATSAAPAAHAAADPGRLRAGLPGRRAGAARARSQDDALRRLGDAVLGAASSACSPTPRATSRAAGSPGTSGSASTAGSCSWRRVAACCSRSRSRSGSRAGRPRWRSGMAAAPFVSLVVVPLGVLAPRPTEIRRDAAATDEARSALRARRPASRVAVLADHARRADAAQRRRADRRRTAADAALAGFVFNVLLIARAPLQLFQAIQTSLLPHLAGLEATEGRDGVRARDPDHGARRSPPSPAPSRSGCWSSARSR